MWGQYMLSGNAFRHQIILPQQQSFYDYWRSKCKAGRLPSRRDIQPEEIPHHLPLTSIVEQDQSSGQNRYRFRLAGTGFWNLYESEIQGHYLDELPIGCRQQYWANIYDNVISKAKPYIGVTQPNTPKSAHLAQFWVRLPLSDNGRDPNMILGFDHLIKLSAIDHVPVQAEKIYA